MYYCLESLTAAQWKPCNYAFNANGLLDSKYITFKLMRIKYINLG